MSVLKRLTVLQSEADLVPVPARQYFHIGQPERMEDVGECVPMLAWADDNLSRYVFSDRPSDAWGRGEAVVIALPNLNVKKGEGVFLVTGHGEDDSVPHPGIEGAKMHFVHLNLDAPLYEDGIRQVYLYKLDGVQVKALGARPKG
ncbi:MAG: hypothetical protein R3B72_25940 [Polyangiaceae bacterium]